MKTEIRPHQTLGVILILLALANLLRMIGRMDALPESLGGRIGLALDLLVWILALVASMYLMRKRIVIEGRVLRLVGLVAGNSDLKLHMDEILDVQMNKRSGYVEVRTSAAKYELTLGERPRRKFLDTLAKFRIPSEAG